MDPNIVAVKINLDDTYNGVCRSYGNIGDICNWKYNYQVISWIYR